MDDLLNFSLLTVGAVAAILNPVGILPQYIAFTAHHTAEERKTVTKRACLIAGALLLTTSFVGTLVFKMFGITAPAFQIAGGVILFRIALDMLHARSSRSMTSPEEQKEGVEKEDISAFPLAVPLIAGPGSITTILILGEKAGSLLQHGIVAVVVALCVAALYLTLTRASRILDWIGHIGKNLLTRLMGLILAAIATQFILTGLELSKLLD